MFITDIIRNEIAAALGHAPSKEEREYFINYIHDGLADKVNAGLPIMMTDVSSAIYLCREECFRCCEECGEYFLPDEMDCFGGHYCLGCRPLTDPDFFNDLNKGN